MKVSFVAFLGVLLMCLAAPHAAAGSNQYGKWGLHWAGEHNSKSNTCSFNIDNCCEEPFGDVEVHVPGDPGRYDVYVIAFDVMGIAGSRYGVCCDGSFYFYAWTKCSDFEIPTAGWLGCGEANAQTWSVEQPGPHVTMGIMDVYVYGTSQLCLCVDSRVGFAEWCDGTSPEPICNSTTEPTRFACVGFGRYGYDPCICDPVHTVSWGSIKAMYR